MNKNIPSSWHYENFRQIIDELNRDEPANNVLIDSHASDENMSNAQMATQKELVEALKYWLPPELPFPNQPNDPVCQEHNKRWNDARALIAKSKGIES